MKRITYALKACTVIALLLLAILASVLAYRHYVTYSYSSYLQAVHMTAYDSSSNTLPTNGTQRTLRAGYLIWDSCYEWNNTTACDMLND